MSIILAVVAVGLGLAGANMILNYQKRYAKMQAKERELKRLMQRRVKALQQEMEKTRREVEARLSDSRDFVLALREKIDTLAETTPRLDKQVSEALAKLKEWEVSKEKPEAIRQIALSQIKTKQAVVGDQIDHLEVVEVGLHQQLDRIGEKLAHLVEQVEEKKVDTKPSAEEAL